ncbi:MAG: alpha/beta hydrolase [Bacillota bacterium]|nr:alpha/beta hydrolase [Bacillota bacterium]
MENKFNLILIFLSIIVIVDLCASNYFYNIAIARSKKRFLQKNKDLHTMSPKTNPEDTLLWLEKQNLRTVEIQSEDFLRLRGYYLEADKLSKVTVILAHGYNSQGKDMAAFAKFYHKSLGYNVLMPDDRGHGQSEGNYIGFGWMDRKDYVKWIDYTINTLNKDSKIILHGVSMGGAAVLMTSGEKLPSNIKAIISDCAYTSVKAELSYQLQRVYKLPSFPILQTTSFLTKIRAGYFFCEASAVKQVGKTKIPILFIHGAEDNFVPTNMVYTLYKSCRSEKDIFIVPNASHANAYNIDKIGYEMKVTQFVSKYARN